jgi:hypothetical protein
MVARKIALPALKAFVILVALTGCASQVSDTSMNYVRTDGRVIDAAQAQSTLAQCKGEAASAVANHVNTPGPIPWLTAMASRPSDEATFTNACMARNGYLRQ